jgi:hypothetical protein
MRRTIRPECLQALTHAASSAETGAGEVLARSTVLFLAYDRGVGGGSSCLGRSSGRRPNSGGSSGSSGSSGDAGRLAPPPGSAKFALGELFRASAEVHDKVFATLALDATDRTKGRTRIHLAFADGAGAEENGNKVECINAAAAQLGKAIEEETCPGGGAAAGAASDRAAAAGERAEQCWQRIATIAHKGGWWGNPDVMGLHVLAAVASAMQLYFGDQGQATARYHAHEWCVVSPTALPWVDPLGPDAAAARRLEAASSAGMQINKRLCKHMLSDRRFGPCERGAFAGQQRAADTVLRWLDLECEDIQWMCNGGRGGIPADGGADQQGHTDSAPAGNGQMSASQVGASPGGVVSAGDAAAADNRAAVPTILVGRYLRRADPCLADDARSLKVPDLRRALRLRGLPTEGLHSTLQDRLASAQAVEGAGEGMLEQLSTGFRGKESFLLPASSAYRVPLLAGFVLTFSGLCWHAGGGYRRGHRCIRWHRYAHTNAGASRTSSSRPAAVTRGSQQPQCLSRNWAHDGDGDAAAQLQAICGVVAMSPLLEEQDEAAGRAGAAAGRGARHVGHSFGQASATRHPAGFRIAWYNDVVGSTDGPRGGSANLSPVAACALRDQLTALLEDDAPQCKKQRC